MSDLLYIVGVDIGGANLKLADTVGRSSCCSFPMWLQPDQLGQRLRELLREFPVPNELAITMTGELADCFATRREGVSRVLDQVAQAFAPEHTFVYAVGNRWLTPAEARQDPWSVAASNWHALATWLCKRSLAPEYKGEGTDPDATLSPEFRVEGTELSIPRSPFLLLDIGSTTTDIIPVGLNQAGELILATTARTDRDRLERQQLVYTGMQRTPIAAIVREVLLHGHRCPVMAERFATSDDCYLILGEVPEVAQDSDTADGRPRTVACAHARLARTIGEDCETLPLADAQQIAEQIIDAQAQQIADAISVNLTQLSCSQSTEISTLGRSPAHIIVGGHGRPLALRAFSKLEQPFTVAWLDQLLSPAISRAAPAAAVAGLRRSVGDRKASQEIP